MIDRLIDALNVEMDLSVEEIADTIWLALQIQPESRAIATAGEEENRELERSDRSFLERDEEISESSFSQREEKIRKGQKEAGIYPPTPAKTAVSVDMSLKIPDAPSLRSPLDLARALKPLMRRMPSGCDSLLDEAKTSQNIAETGVWLPVLQPTLEPWLDLELVVDESLSMHLWRRAIAEWVRLLKNYGIFRNVRIWGLLVEDGRVGIRRGIGGIGKNQRFRSPDELVDPTGRRLVLVVSDCVSSFWREGKMVAVLEAWGKRQPMAIVQMLPRWLWGRTSLGRGATVRLRGLSPGVANRALRSEAVSLWDGEGGIKVPVLTLEAERAAIWAQMVAGKGVWCSGVAFAREGWREESEGEKRDRLTAADRVQGFRVTASPMARKLAGLLASAPVITLPVVRLIREQCLRESQQVHVAEVFLGGLLKPLTEIDADTNPDLVRYDFIEGVRELLIESVPSSYVLDVVDKVSQFIARKLGLSLENFAAVLKNPQEVLDGDVVEEVRPFAMVTAQVLRCLGGEYAKFAEELERQNRVSDRANLEESLERSSEIKYRVGGCLNFDSSFYIERPADTELYNRIKAGNVCILSAPRQMGKSSLIYRTSQRLREEGWTCAVIDLTLIGSDGITERGWYRGLIYELAHELNLEKISNFFTEQFFESYTQESHPYLLVRFFDEIIENIINLPIVVFMDEVDCALNLEFFANFCSLVRALYERRFGNEKDCLVFVLCGVFLSSDLHKNIFASPLTNVAVEIELKGFTYEEAKPLAN
ncbi:SAV_2336 N-terminal domain-related protein, partial [Spirulina sp. 06S082]|uniref:SAV_2336 N-terminal domain-related protein n=1 Tax=Spirulina sp. 06S082 TaxID=3110248 RepID=UPI002B1F6301